MKSSILVVYATTHGSTREVADAVAAALRGRGMEADVRPAGTVRSLEGYGAIVLGAPLYMFRLHRQARSFLSRHRSALGKRPLALFVLGPFNDREEEWRGAREQLDQALAAWPDLAPVTSEVFGGRFDPAKLRFPWKLLPALKRLPATDIRDWQAIGAWAEGLAAKLPPA